MHITAKSNPGLLEMLKKRMGTLIIIIFNHPKSPVCERTAYLETKQLGVEFSHAAGRGNMDIANSFYLRWSIL